jgi:ABC-type glutathione transport system ATPase component
MPAARHGQSAGTARWSASATAQRGSPNIGPDAMTFLVLERLSKSFGEQIAVDQLSLAVGRGEFVSLLGPSGCGKTTTLQMIAGFHRPSNGTILLEGHDLTAVKPARRGLGVVFQSYALFPHLTAAENVAFGLEMQGVARAEREARVKQALALVGLGAFVDRFPRRLSGGSSSVSHSPAPWSSDHAFSCSTSPFPISMPNCARTCRSSCARSSARLGPRPFS